MNIPYTSCKTCGEIKRFTGKATICRRCKREAELSDMITKLKAKLTEVKELSDFIDEQTNENAELGAELAEKDAEIERLKEALVEYTDYRPDVGKVLPIKPTHGPCCTCQDCGQHYDDCVCEHNAICELLGSD